MDYGSNNGRTYQPIIKVYDNTVKGNVATLGTGKTEVSQFKENETKVQSDYVLTYTNSFGDHNLTATAGFTTYYNSLSRLDAARGQGIGLVIPDNPDNGSSVLVIWPQLPMEVHSGNVLLFLFWGV